MMDPGCMRGMSDMGMNKGCGWGLMNEWVSVGWEAAGWLRVSRTASVPYSVEREVPLGQAGSLAREGERVCYILKNEEDLGIGKGNDSGTSTVISAAWGQKLTQNKDEPNLAAFKAQLRSFDSEVFY